MANTIKHKRSTTQGSVPSTSALELGEIAINTYDGVIFIKRDNGTPSVVAIGGGVGVTDGDKGDITVSNAGLTWVVDSGAITYAKIQNVSATDKILGRLSAGAGTIEEITCTAAGRALIDDADAAAQRTTLGLGTLATQSGTFSGTSSGTNTGDQTITLTGDVTGSGTGSFATTIGNSKVTYAKIQNVSAADKLLGRSTAGAGVVEEITCTAAGRALLDDADATAQRATLGLGTLATQSGTFSGTSSGTNTGDQTITLTGDVTGSGTGSFAATIASKAVTYAKIQDVSATDKLLGRSTAGAGVVEEITCTAAGRALLDDADAAAQRTTLGLGTLATQSGTFSGTSSGTNTGDQTITLTGDVTGSGTGSFSATIALKAVTYAKIQDVSATDRLLGRSTAGAGVVEEITCTAAGRALIDDADAAAQRTTLGLGTLATQSGTFSGTSSGTNTGDQNLFSTISVSGQSNVVADSTSDTLTLVAGSNITITTNSTTDTITIAASSLSDGDKGDITVSGSGATWSIDSQAVTYAKIQNVSATDRLLGRSTAGAGVIEEITCTAAGRALLDDADAAAQRTTLGLGTLATQSGTFSGTSSGTNTGDQTITLTGDVTGSGTGSFAATIGNSKVTYAKIQNVSTTDRILGRFSAGAGLVEEITCTSAGRALIDDADAAAQRTTLGLGTLATQSGTFSGTSSGTNTGDQNLFSTIAVSGQTNVVADTTSDTLTLVAGSNITITTNATTDSITISSTGGGITSLNSLTTATQTFATGTTGTDFNISSATSTHTFNIPDASTTARGLITTGTQSFTGTKTFNAPNSSSSALIVKAAASASVNVLDVQNSSANTLLSVDPSGNVVVAGNLTINGTTQTVNSTTVTVDDPTITLGGDTAPTLDDGKDRGVEFRWHNGTSAKVGFFGFDDSSQKFIFIPDATNTSEVFSGTAGDSVFRTVESTVATGTAPLTVASTTAVTNLNADLLDGLHASAIISPTGMISAFGGASAPSGWLLCDGTAVNTYTYRVLHAIISNTYGGTAYLAGTTDQVGASTTFNLPDLRQRFPLGKAASGTGSTLGGTGGAIDHTHGVPAHYHGLGTLATDTTGSGHGHANTLAVGTTNSGHGHGNTLAIGTTGSGHSHSTFSLSAAGQTLGTTGRSATGSVGGSDGTHTHSIASSGAHRHELRQEAGGGGTQVTSAANIISLVGSTVAAYRNNNNTYTDGEHTHSISSSGGHGHSFSLSTDISHTHAASSVTGTIGNASDGTHTHNISGSVGGTDGTHTHNITGSVGGSDGTHTHNLTGLVGATGGSNGDSAFATLGSNPPFLAVNYIIKT